MRSRQGKNANGGVFVSNGYFLRLLFARAEEGGYIALNPETGTTTQGETIGGAVANLRNATAIHLEEFPLVLGCTHS